MKRSKHIRLLLIGGVSAGAMAACSPSGTGKPPLSAETVYPNDYHVPGVGYYHAPFCAWFPRPFNYFDPATKLYFYGGSWAAFPCRSITNVSSPSPAAAARAEAARTDVVRGGFGGCAGGRYYGGA